MISTVKVDTFNVSVKLTNFKKKKKKKENTGKKPNPPLSADS